MTAYVMSNRIPVFLRGASVVEGTDLGGCTVLLTAMIWPIPLMNRSLQDRVIVPFISHPVFVCAYESVSLLIFG